MSTTTEKLSLFKYDTTADAKQPFSITNCMNNNWDKIDAFAKSVDTVFASDFSSQLDKKVFSDINDKLGQKLEAEVLLAENGYIKFNNGVIIIWGLEETTVNYTGRYITLPISLTTTHVPVVVTDHQIVDTPGNVHNAAGISSLSQIYICHSSSYRCWMNYIIVGK